MLREALEHRLQGPRMIVRTPEILLRVTRKTAIPDSHHSTTTILQEITGEVLQDIQEWVPEEVVAIPRHTLKASTLARATLHHLSPTLGSLVVLLSSTQATTRIQGGLLVGTLTAEEVIRAIPQDQATLANLADPLILPEPHHPKAPPGPTTPEPPNPSSNTRVRARTL